jgi:AcrR family transcriptional regulator
MVNAAKTAARRQTLKEALVNAAAEAIGRQGLTGLKARALADAAGCAVGAIYNVVADLDELILEVNARTLRALEADLTAAGRPPAGAPDADWAIAELTRMAVAYLDFAAKNVRLWRAVYDHRLPEGGKLPKSYLDEQMRLFTFIEEPLRILQPGASAHRYALLARSLTSAVHGIVMLGLEEKLYAIPLPALREQVSFVAAAIGRGLVAPEAAPSV